MARITMISGTEQQLPKFIYIIGGGHSGSTLLDMIIGSSDRVFSVGELFYLDIYLGRRNGTKMLPKGRTCTCGAAFDECSFWSDVVVDAAAEVVRKPRTVKESLQIVANLLNPFEKMIRFSTPVGRNKAVFDRIFDRAIEEKSDVEFILDSSKDPRRLYELVWDDDIPQRQIYVIHLIRDGRGYVHAYQEESRLDRRGTLKVLSEWILINTVSSIITRKYTLKSLSVSYDKFCENPAVYIKELNAFLGIELDADGFVEKVNSSTYHNVHGSLSRFVQLREILYDDMWKTDLPRLKRWLLTIILHPFNSIWVYPK